VSDVPASVPAWGNPVGGPVWRAWREGTLTRAKELESLCAWVAHDAPPPSGTLLEAAGRHLEAARQAAEHSRRFADKAALERAMSNLDAAEALLLTAAPPAYLLGRLPGVLHAVTAARAAASGALREQLRVRSFRHVLVVTSAMLAVLAVVLGVIGYRSPTTIPLCFAPEAAGQAMVVCPTEQSAPYSTDQAPGTQARDVDDAVQATANPVDVLLVELVGLAAAAIAAAAAIRGIRGSSEPHGLPVAVAVLKLPTGALTALLGLLLMRGGFVPGLTALDTSAQILAWALVFGYAQQLFTRLVDQQAHNVLGAVRGGGDRARTRTPESVG
jgi:hypothetical protein